MARSKTESMSSSALLACHQVHEKATKRMCGARLQLQSQGQPPEDMLKGLSVSQKQVPGLPGGGGVPDCPVQ